MAYYNPFADFENYLKKEKFDNDVFNEYGPKVYDESYDWLYTNYARELAREKLMNNPDDLLKQLTINREYPNDASVKMNVLDVLDRIKQRR